MKNLLKVDPRPFEEKSVSDILHYFLEHESKTTPFTFIDYTNTGPVENALSYRDMDLRARRIAALLQQKGRKGDRVLLAYPAGLDYLCAFFACIYAGMVAVPVYPGLNVRLQSRLVKLAEDCQATLALSNTEVISSQASVGNQPPYFKKIVWLDTDVKLEGLENLWIKQNTAAGDLAFLQYTSGSTGSPKGVMVTHENIMHNVRAIALQFQFKPSDHHFSWLPPYHDMGLIGSILACFSAGIPVSFMAPFAFLRRPLRWLQQISERRCTISGAPNFAYELCLNKIGDEEVEQLDLSCWELAFSGAEPVRPNTLLNFAKRFSKAGFNNKAFYPCYGMAENTLIISGIKRQQGVEIGCFDDDKPNVVCALSYTQPLGKNNSLIVSCGEHVEGMEIRIVDPETLKPIADGQTGEIVVAGKSVTAGYWKNEELTKNCYNLTIENSDKKFLRSGDLGKIINQKLFVCGRIKDTMIIRGVNYYPHDIEDVINNCHKDIRPGSGIATSIVSDDSEELIFVQEVNPHTKTDLAEIIKKIHSEISSHFTLQPFAIILIKNGTIPKTTSGKLSRHPCRQAFLNNTLTIIQSWKNPIFNKSE